MKKTLMLLLAFAVLTLFVATVQVTGADNSPPVAVVAVMPTAETAQAVNLIAEPAFLWTNATGAEVATANQINPMHGLHAQPDQHMQASATPEVVKRI